MNYDGTTWKDNDIPPNTIVFKGNKVTLTGPYWNTLKNVSAGTYPYSVMDSEGVVVQVTTQGSGTGFNLNRLKASGILGDFTVQDNLRAFSQTIN
jgi:hypothetical protein